MRYDRNPLLVSEGGEVYITPFDAPWMNGAPTPTIYDYLPHRAHDDHFFGRSGEALILIPASQTSHTSESHFTGIVNLPDFYFAQQVAAELAAKK